MTEKIEMSISYPARHLTGIEGQGKIVNGNVKIEKTKDQLTVIATYDLKYNGDGTILRREIATHMTKLGMGLGVLDEK